MALAGLDPATTDSDAEDDTYSYWKDSSTLSEANIELASTWSSSCLNQHSRCGIDTNYTAPTRLIHVKGPHDLALEVSGGRILPYLTLSYKWGDSKKYLTLAENIADHGKKIPFEALPKTFQDAVRVTRRLGFEYLWIDALCIIHDSPEDLRKEISEMGSIYQASKITLFAEAGDDADAGLSVSRDPRSSKPCILDLRATLDSDTLEASRYACYDPFSELEFPPAPASIYQRGWVLQEEVLAQRLLKFGARQIKWECQHGAFWESLPDEDDGSATLNSTHSELRSWMYDRQVPKDLDGREGREMFMRWGELVENYCKRSLTYVNDVLPAIAGIASVFSRNNQLSYINGLWKEEFPLGLLWNVDDGHETDASHRARPKVVDITDAPSWTWLSKWGEPIEFQHEQLSREHRTVMIDQLGHPHDNIDDTNRSRDRTPSDQFINLQAVDARPLPLRGHLIKGDVQLGSWSPRLPTAWGRCVTTHDTRENIGLFFPDSDPFKEPILEITCCLCILSETVGVGFFTYWWLALASTSQPDVYRRVGMGRGTNNDKTQGLRSLWEAEGKATFTLV